MGNAAALRKGPRRLQVPPGQTGCGEGQVTGTAMWAPREQSPRNRIRRRQAGVAAGGAAAAQSWVGLVRQGSAPAA